MCNIRHILRLHTQNQTQSEIINQTGIARKTLQKYLQDFKKSGLSFPEINELGDKDLEELFPRPEEKVDEKYKVLYDYFVIVDRELKRKGVTKRLLWQEYLKKHPDGFSESRFGEHFFKWKMRVRPSMRKEHRAGDKLYIDFAGEKLSILNEQTNEPEKVEVFVAILGASQLTYVQAVMSQKKEDFIGACEDALHYLGGVPAAIVTDNLRSAVSKSNRYEPTINETFADFAEHYGTTILPARAYKPKDKATVEVVIRIIYTRIYAPLRDQVFKSLEDLNKAIRIELENHNNEPMSGSGKSRRQGFEETERSTLTPLPLIRYEFKKQNFGTVFKHCHVCLTADRHYYSVPYKYIGKRVKIVYTRYRVEIFFEYERIAWHKRAYQRPYKYTTDIEHLPPSQRFINQLSLETLLDKAQEIHEDVKNYLIKILNERKHDEQAIKVCLGILSFARKVGNDRLIMACRRANDFGLYKYHTIRNILERKLEKQEEHEEEKSKMPEHENIRGRDYYQ